MPLKCMINTEIRVMSSVWTVEVALLSSTVTSGDAEGQSSMTDF